MEETEGQPVGHEQLEYGDDESTWPSWWSPHTLLMSPVLLPLGQS